MAYYLFLSPFTISLIYIGLIGAIIVYDSIHYYCHFGPEINIKWLKYLRINHLKHHYRDPTRYFGVTNTIWDEIFGTNEKSKQKIWLSFWFIFRLIYNLKLYNFIRMTDSIDYLKKNPIISDVIAEGFAHIYH